MLIDRESLERVTTIDLLLMQRFPRRSLQRLARLLSRVRGPDGVEREDTPAVLAGLEVYWTSGGGWVLNVTAGAIVAPPGTPTADTTRPGTWTGKDDTDEDTSYIFELPNAGTATPTSAPGGALASAEWWIVYARMETEIVEADAGRQVFDEGTGAFVAAGSTLKVGAYRTTLHVKRGDPGANLAHSSTQLPGGVGVTEVALAFVWIPAGATSLIAAQIYDVRPLHAHDKGPNEVGGSWAMEFDGTLVSPYTTATYAVQGNVWARHRGELLEVSNAGETTLIGQLEPGASWGAAGPGLNKIAYVYLCRVRGAVPRYVRLGEDRVGDNTPTDGPRIAGVLVVSATPPRLDVGLAASASAFRWDLRASAAIALPDVVGSAKSHRFAGVTCDALDAICVGMIGYDAVDVGGGPSGQDIPKLDGPVALTPDGWLVGRGINTRANSWFSAVNRTGNGAMTGAVSAVLNVVGSDTLPIIGLRGSVEVTMPSAGDVVTFGGWSASTRRRAFDNGAAAFEAAETIESWQARPGYTTIAHATISTAANMSGNPIVIWGGLRFPTRTPLVTT